jgi:hypothetical protein
MIGATSPRFPGTSKFFNASDAITLDIRSLGKTMIVSRVSRRNATGGSKKVPNAP